jgi:hypothetical protein
LEERLVADLRRHVREDVRRLFRSLADAE